MKRTMTIVLVVLVALLASCGLVSVTGSGNVVTQEEAIAGFDKVEISQGFTVDISQGDTFGVVIQVDDNLVQYLRVVKQDSTLKIGLDRNRSYKDATLKAEVIMPELTSLTLNSGSHATVGGSGGDVTIDASAGSGADLSGFAVVNADVTAIKQGLRPRRPSKADRVSGVRSSSRRRPWERYSRSASGARRARVLAHGVSSSTSRLEYG